MTRRRGETGRRGAGTGARSEFRRGEGALFGEVGQGGGGGGGAVSGGGGAGSVGGGVFVAYRRVEVDVAVGFDDAGRILGFDFFDFEVVIFRVVGDADDVSFGDAAEVAEGVFQDGARVGNFEEVDVLRLEFDEVGFGQADVGHGEDGALFDEEVLHHPKRDDAGPFFGGEFQHSAVGQRAFVGGLQLEQHGVVDLEARQDVEGRGRQEDLVALFQVGLVGVGGAVAVVLFFEAVGQGVPPSQESPSSHHLATDCFLNDFVGTVGGLEQSKLGAKLGRRCFGRRWRSEVKRRKHWKIFSV
mmetsp:Transcript_28446/g.59419  ORF Transcript_28446/g.59419 Transcript_28446/m.59419 type:complete len:300 (+) Transcript_28446:799-1698(+)